MSISEAAYQANAISRMLRKALDTYEAECKAMVMGLQARMALHGGIMRTYYAAQARVELLNRVFGPMGEDGAQWGALSPGELLDRAQRGHGRLLRDMAMLVRGLASTGDMNSTCAMSRTLGCIRGEALGLLVEELRCIGVAAVDE